MKIVAFDTSTSFLSIACLEDDKVILEYHEEVGMRHNEILVSAIKDILEKVSWRLEDIELICVGLGPGSFTGLRIAISTVKGLALVAGCKVIGVPTMDAVVMNYKGEAKRIAPLLDARKEKVYSCIYSLSSGEYKKETDYMLLGIEELLGSLEEETLFFGDAIDKYKEILNAFPKAEYSEEFDWVPRAVNIGKIGFKRSFTGTDDPETIDPIYLHAKECNITKKL